jgi:hypothetical protein
MQSHVLDWKGGIEIETPYGLVISRSAIGQRVYVPCVIAPGKLGRTGLRSPVMLRCRVAESKPRHGDRDKRQISRLDIYLVYFIERATFCAVAVRRLDVLIL